MVVQASSRECRQSYALGVSAAPGASTDSTIRGIEPDTCPVADRGSTSAATATPLKTDGRSLSRRRSWPYWRSLRLRDGKANAADEAAANRHDFPASRMREGERCSPFTSGVRAPR